ASGQPSNGSSASSSESDGSSTSGSRGSTGGASSSRCGYSVTRLAPQVLVMETMSELIPLGGQIATVLVVRRNLDRHLLDDGEAEAVDARQLLRVVREDADRREAEVGEDLVADPVVARVGGEAELGIRLHGVEA